MYRFSYAEILEESSNECRERERMAFDHAIDLLKAAAVKGPDSSESAEALSFIQELWTLLIEDLLSEVNGLPEQLRAEIISIGLWSIKQADAIKHGESTNYSGLIDINTIIRDGLK